MSNVFQYYILLQSFFCQRLEEKKKKNKIFLLTTIGTTVFVAFSIRAARLDDEKIFSKIVFWVSGCHIPRTLASSDDPQRETAPPPFSHPGEDGWWKLSVGFWGFFGGGWGCFFFSCWKAKMVKIRKWKKGGG